MKKKKERKTNPASIRCWVRLNATVRALCCEMVKSQSSSGCPWLKPGGIHGVLQGRRMLLGVLQCTADHLSHRALLILDFFLEA